jgi:hypothetical protein
MFIPPVNACRPSAIRSLRWFRKEDRDFPAGGPQRADDPAERPPRSHRVEQQPNPHSLPGPGGERLDEPFPDDVDVQNEELGVDMVRRLADQREQRVVRLVAARQEGDAVPGDRGRRFRRLEDGPALSRQSGGEVRCGETVIQRRRDRGRCGDLGPDVPPDPSDADEVVERDPDQREQGDGEHPGESCRRLAPLQDDARDQEEREDVACDVEPKEHVLPQVVHCHLAG